MSKLIAEFSHPVLDEQRVWDILSNVPDPELPVISVVDMGIVQHIQVDAARSYIHVDITPTFAGCPAISQIRAEIRNRLLQLASTVEVDVTVQPWTSDLLKEEAREKLRRVGIAPPPKSVEDAPCPCL